MRPRAPAAPKVRALAPTVPQTRAESSRAIANVLSRIELSGAVGGGSRAFSVGAAPAQLAASGSAALSQEELFGGDESDAIAGSVAAHRARVNELESECVLSPIGGVGCARRARHAHRFCVEAGRGVSSSACARKEH